MFVLDITGADHKTERHVCTTSSITIGSSDGCEIRLAGTRPSHATVNVGDGLVWIRATGPVINISTERAIQHEVMRSDTPLSIVGNRVCLVDVAPRQFEASYGPIDQAEAALVDAIIDGDAASRIVYADWLDDHGDPRAEIVRTLEGGIAPEREQLALLVRTNVRWRARVLQPAIESCARQKECPSHWGAVERTGRADLRRCGRCAKLVLYCVDAAQAREHLRLGGVVVLDPLSLRWPGDLAVR